MCHNCVLRIEFKKAVEVKLYHTIRYDRVYLTCSKKLTGSQLCLPHGINKKLKCETKNKLMSMIGYNDILWYITHDTLHMHSSKCCSGIVYIDDTIIYFSKYKLKGTWLPNLVCGSQSSVWTFLKHRRLGFSDEDWMLPSSAATATNTASDRCPLLIKCRIARSTLPAATQYGSASSLSASAKHSACLHHSIIFTVTGAHYYYTTYNYLGM